MIRSTVAKRDALLHRISAECSQRLCYLGIIENETFRRDGVETWRELCRANQAERAALTLRELRATRLAVRLMYTPQGRRDRDEELAADISDQRAFGLRDGEREATAWEWRDER